MAKFIAIPAPSTVAATIGEVLIAADRHYNYRHINR